MNIEKKLADLELMYAKRDFIEFQKRQLISSILTTEIEEQLQEVEEEFAPDLTAINNAIKMAEGDIKDDVLEHKETVAIDTMQAIYRRGSKRWDTKGLEKYAKDHPEIEQFRITGKPSVSVQSRKVQS